MRFPKPAQIRAARAFLGWRQVDLAGRTGLSEITIKLIEQGRSSPKVATMEKIEAAFRSEGVEFDDCVIMHC
ncbi:helix-turn-helix transcriptional regulator [bacterium]|nr:helix-turn-helix transcriptional regulator [bacterium]